MHGGEGEAPAASGRGGELEGVAQGSGARPHGPVSEDTRSRGLIAAQKEAGSAFSAPAAAGAGASGRTLRLRRGGEISPGEERPVAGGAPRAGGGGAGGGGGAAQGARCRSGWARRLGQHFDRDVATASTDGSQTVPERDGQVRELAYEIPNALVPGFPGLFPSQGFLAGQVESQVAALHFGVLVELGEHFRGQHSVAAHALVELDPGAFFFGFDARSPRAGTFLSNHLE